MFKISVVKPENIDRFCTYMDYRTNGIMLECIEGGEITGGICFDLFERGAIIQKVKSDSPDMTEIIIKSALNFLDLNNIYDVYIAKNDDKIYKLLGFKDEENLMHLNIFGYFGKEHHHG